MREYLSWHLARWLSPTLGNLAAHIITALVAVFLLLGFVAVSAVFFIWLERKVAGRIQDRLGPTRVGGKFGWLQSVADGIKLFVKEDLVPATADQMLFRLGPYITFAGSFLAFIVLPFGPGIVALDLNITVFFMLAVMSTEIFGVILGGYGSGNKWSLYGGLREAAQMVSYEVPMSLCVLIPVIVAGTMSLTHFGRQQQGLFWNWYVFHDPFTFAAFFLYLACAIASCKRAPFDLAEAESELVAGFLTEFSGLRWSFFFMAEYASMFAVGGIATLLFLGGWHTGLLPLDPADRFPLLGGLIDVVVFIFKSWLLVFVMMWVRWTLPRLRIDQVMETCLKYLLPLGCVLLLGVTLWQILAWDVLLIWLKVPVAIASLALTVYALCRVVTTPSELPFPGVKELTQEWQTASTRR